jgi:hypothetical protein
VRVLTVAGTSPDGPEMVLRMEEDVRVVVGVDSIAFLHFFLYVYNLNRGQGQLFVVRDARISGVPDRLCLWLGMLHRLG